MPASVIAHIMLALARARDALSGLQNANCWQSLEERVAQVCGELGCSYFALTHHVDFADGSAPGIRLHNYPASWAEWFDARGLGANDPVHRASHATAAGFHWREVERLVTLTELDRTVLDRAAAHGIGDGVTIPAHVPGELRGSCSFAVKAGDSLDAATLPFAQVAGSFAFEAARRLAVRTPGTPLVHLTQRQIECVLWVARGKTDWEIAQILRVSPTTVIEHLRNARERCDAPTRATLAVRALFEGAISFSDVIGR
jgi:LuxR family quorum-sensing system transcriptional regulator CciR